MQFTAVLFYFNCMSLYWKLLPEHVINNIPDSIKWKFIYFSKYTITLNQGRQNINVRYAPLPLFGTAYSNISAQRDYICFLEWVIFVTCQTFENQGHTFGKCFHV